jgi:AraC family transcriptional activator of tynA and feaB
MQGSFEPSNSAQARQAWSSDLWRWQPEQGRWSAERHGLPRTAVFLSLSTAPERPRDRYEFWRHIALYDFDGHPRGSDSPEGFQASASGLVGPNGSLFSYECDSLSGERNRVGRRADDWDDITVGFLVEGERRHVEGDDRTITGCGQFFAYDAGRDSLVQSTRSRGLLLAMRRPVLEAVFGGAIPSSAMVARTVAKSPLAPFLSSQMRLLAELAGGLDESDRAAMLQNTVDLLVMTLSGTAGRESPEEEGHGARRLLVAALNVIEASLSNVLLGPEMLASALGCSRAKLYRAFAEYGLTISAAIREMRLKQARTMIETLPSDISIADIGMRCGFLDAANFSRNFRLYFGASPTELRRQG